MYKVSFVKGARLLRAHFAPLHWREVHDPVAFAHERKAHNETRKQESKQGNHHAAEARRQ